MNFAEANARDHFAIGERILFLYEGHSSIPLPSKQGDIIQYHSDVDSFSTTDLEVNDIVPFMIDIFRDADFQRIICAQFEIKIVAP